MKYKIVKKAWRVNADKFDEPWYHGHTIYYGTKGQAKQSAVSHNTAGKLKNGKVINFINIPVRRAYEYDEILFHGEIIKRYEVESKLRESKMKKLPKDKMYYVQDKRNYVGNAVLWWGLNGNGYVTDLSKAQKYTWEQIQKFYPRETDIIWEAEHVEKAVRLYVDMQGLDFSRCV